MSSPSPPKGRPLSLATPAVPETLRARPRRWLSRLWVRVSLVLMLIFAISLFAWWLPRRTIVSVWWNGGVVTCEKDRARAGAVLDWFDPTGGGWAWQHFRTMYRLLGWTRTDIEITWVTLSDSKVTDDWLVRLKGFPNLKGTDLHDRQLGTGLDHLRGRLTLKLINIHSASDRHLVELRRLPQLESLGLWEPQSGDIGLESLTDLSNLNSLFIGDCKHTDEVLEALPELPLLESLVIQDCKGFVDDDLRHLQRLPNLKYLDVVCSTSSLGDVALEHLSQLNRLETLALRTPWKDVTDEGLAKLAGMKSLKQMYVLGHQCSPSQLQRLRKALPNCAITVN